MKNICLGFKPSWPTELSPEHSRTPLSGMSQLTQEHEAVLDSNCDLIHCSLGGFTSLDREDGLVKTIFQGTISIYHRSMISVRTGVRVAA